MALSSVNMFARLQHFFTGTLFQFSVNDSAYHVFRIRFLKLLGRFLNYLILQIITFIAG